VPPFGGDATHRNTLVMSLSAVPPKRPDNPVAGITGFSLAEVLQGRNPLERGPRTRQSGRRLTGQTIA